MAMVDRLTRPLRRVLDALDRAISGAVLLREAARTSRQWQTHAARTAFSGVLIGVLLLGIQAAVNATQTAMLDAANLGWLGRGLFVAFAVTQLCLAILLAPLLTASAIVEETDERTLDLLVLTRLSPGQILGAKVTSRILLLLTVVCGALPVMAMVVNLGGVSGIEVLSVTVHTLVTVVILGSLGAFFALFTRSPMLATMASASFALPFFLLVPLAYVICTGDPYDAAHFSTLAAASARDPSALLPALSYLPSLAMIFAVATPLFQLKVSHADFAQAFSDDVWHTPRWAKALGGWVIVAVGTLPVAVPTAWWLQNASRPQISQTADLVLHIGVVAWIWLLFAAGSALATWAFLRVGMDVVDGIDGLFAGPGSSRDRKPAHVGSNPVWWREARPRAWSGTAAPIFVTWMLVLLAVFQTGFWIFPGGILAIGGLNTAAALLLTAFLASRSIAEERRRGSLEVLLTTTLPSWRIVLGKAGGALMPTLPLVLVSLPLLVIGVPHLGLLTDDDPGLEHTLALGLKGLAAWVWLLPVWLLAAGASMAVALRARRPAASFGMVAASLALGLGLPGVLGRIFPEVAWVAVPARLVAPPLAGGESWGHLAFSTVALTGLAAWLAITLTRRFRAWAVGALAAALWLLLAVPEARAQPSPEAIAALEKVSRLRMRATPLADGLAREGGWTSVSVVLENAGPATSGVLTWEEPGTEPGSSERFARSVELPEGARKQVELLVRVGRTTRDRVLELATREGRRAVAVTRLRPLGRDDVGLAVIGTDPLGLPGAVQVAWPGPVPARSYRETAGDDRKVRTGLVHEATLPAQSAAWDAVDQVLWPAADPSGVPEARLRALTSWVADGGHLVLTVTDTWRQVEASPLADALPGRLTGIRDADVQPLAMALGRLSGGVAPTATVELGRARDVWVRARTHDGAPLWISARWGLGTIHLLTADLRTAPLDTLDRPLAFRRLLALPAPGDGGALVPDGLHRALHLQRASWWHDDVVRAPDEVELAREARIRERLSAIPGVAPLPMTWLVAFGTVYLLIIGPVDFLVLRWLHRQPLTWITFPVAIALFGGIALVGTSYTKGSQAVLTRVERVDLLPDARLMRGDTWLGIFSTRKTHLALQSGMDDAVLAPLQVPGFMTSPEIRAGAGPGRLDYDAETWTLGYARSRWTAPLEAGLDATRQPDGNIVLTSSLPFDLADAAVLVGSGASDVSGWIRLGALPAGGRVVVPDRPDNAEPLPASEPLDGDDLIWAARTFYAPAPDGRGSLNTAATPLTFLGVARRTLEPVELDGLSPVDQPLLVVRMPLPDDLAVDVELEVLSIEVAIDPALHVYQVELTCDAEVRSVPNPTVRPISFDGIPAASPCRLRVDTDHGPATLDVRAGQDVACTPEPDHGVSCVLEER